jgi:chromosomal replication initiation ATPase DnaA
MNTVNTDLNSAIASLRHRVSALERIAGLYPSAIRSPIQRVMDLISARYSLSREDLLSRSRSSSIVWPRQVAIYLLRMHYGYSYPECARAFRRTAGAAMHAVESVTNRAQTEPKIAAQIEDLFGHLAATKGRHAHTIPDHST